MVGAIAEWIDGHFTRVLFTVIFTVGLIIVVVTAPSFAATPLTPEHNWDNLPSGASPVWVQSDKRAYRLDGCLWFDRWVVYRGGYWTPMVTDDGVPATECAQ